MYGWKLGCVWKIIFIKNSSPTEKLVLIIFFLKSTIWKISVCTGKHNPDLTRCKWKRNIYNIPEKYIYTILVEKKTGLLDRAIP